MSPFLFREGAALCFRRSAKASGVRFFVPFLLALSCAHDPPPAPTAPPEALRPRDLYPLRVGNQWTYDIRAGGQEATRTVVITGQQDDGFFVDNRHGKLRVDERGLRDGDRYLIESPVEKGHGWFSVQSLHSTERFEIIDAGRPCTVRAGTFGRCVTVRASSKVDATRTLLIESTYAEGVGLVALRTWQVLPKDTTPLMNMELVAFRLAP